MRDTAGYAYPLAVLWIASIVAAGLLGASSTTLGWVFVAGLTVLALFMLIVEVFDL